MFRTIYISKENELTIKNNWLIIKSISSSDIHRIPLSDIQTIIIDNMQTMISTSTLYKFTENGINTIFCNNKHLPYSNLLAINKHYRSPYVLNKQINLSDNMKNLIWSKIIKGKINNQISVLKYYNIEELVITKLNEFKNNILPGDTTNREAICSKIFFYQLYGKNFKRFEDDTINIALNYGYSIIRSAIARTLVAYGYNCSLGIHHKNQFNMFNLTDDLIEPFRPIVDLWVAKNKYDFNLTKTDRLSLVNLLNHEMLYNNKKYKVYIVIDKYISKFTSCINNNDINTFYLPKIFIENEK